MVEPTIAGALYTAESLLEGAVAFAKGITHPTLPLKANLSRITDVPLPRSHHTLSVVKGRAYIFGGETSPGTLADNAMHIVILPSSGVTTADYTSIAARPMNTGGEVPQARKGHTSVVIGDSIYIFGGEGVGDEMGRIWVYSTTSNSWYSLDPASDSPCPSHRYGHAAAISELPPPRDEVVYRERAPQRPADPAKVVPEPADPDTWGTMFVVGGRSLTGELMSDALAFDVRTRTWSNIPSPLGQPREGASMTIVGNKLYRFGGKGIETIATGGLQAVDVSLVWKHAEDGTTPLTSGWAWEEVEHVEGEAPQARSGTGLESVTTGQGRHYLIALGGEGEDGRFFDDIWAFQLPSERQTAAAAKDSTRSSVKASTNEGKWAEAKYEYLDSIGEEEKEIPGEPKHGLGIRGHFAVAKGTEVDGASVIAWGGVDQAGKILSDGWLVTVDR
ncbi:galactose oxidase [Lojkania enalia]|uniref:Galactose oxidase n=1 Tax=Lojkania enalia TaxID=147567 RepID=A0A9P4KHF0_9PLEO|nr:galactose oxidase [Didymosphaeria enalia]